MKKFLKVLIIILILIAILATAYVLIFLRKSDNDDVISSVNFSEELSNKLKDSVVLLIGSSFGYVNNTKIQIDSESKDTYPVVRDGRTLVPVRFISERLGATVNWDKGTSTVTIQSNGKTVNLKINSKEIIINGEKSQIDVPAQIINERTFIPLRALAEGLGKKLFWDNRGLIVISDIDNILIPETDMELINEIIEKFFEEGNRSNNIKNLGLAVQRGDWLYCGGDTLFKEKIDGSEKIILDIFSANCLNVVGEWIYYANSWENTLIKMKTDGSANLSLLKNAYNINIMGNWIYFIDSEAGGTLYRIKLDGTSKTKVSSDKIKSFIISDNWIYYINVLDRGSYTERQLCKVFITGENKKVLIKEMTGSINELVVDGNWIYFVNGNMPSDEYGNLYRIKTDDTQRTLLKEGMIKQINVDGGMIYFVNGDEKDSLYQMEVDGTEDMKVCEDTGVSNISIDGDWIYYVNTLENSSLYRINKDGSSKTKL